jgi:serine protease Do
MASTSPALHDTGLVPFLSGLSAALVRVVATGDGGKRVATADGVLIGSGGYVLAPTTVLADASSVSVVRSDGEQLIAAVKGVDAGTGLVLLSIDGSGLPHMALSTSRSVPRDSFVLVAWRESKATVAIERLTGWAAKTNFRDGPALLEVCPVSLHLGRAPDGALVVGGDGRIAGLVTGHRHGQAIVTPGWLAARVAAQLATAGHVTHGWLGIAGRTARLASDGKYKVNPAAGDTNARMTSNLRTRGVVVEKVVRDSAAYRAGISRGDVIEALDGRPVYGMAQLQAMLYLLPPSSEVHLEVARGAELSRVDARLQAAA